MNNSSSLTTMIEAISHITFIAVDVERMAAFLTAVFDAQEVYDSSRKNHSHSYEKFFLIGGIWIAVMEGKPHSERTYNHVAFKVSGSQFDEYVARLKKLGIEIEHGRGRIDGEGRSIYFYDYDNHLFELHTGTLQDRLSAYAKSA